MLFNTKDSLNINNNLFKSYPLSFINKKTLFLLHCIVFLKLKKLIVIFKNIIRKNNIMNSNEKIMF